MSEMNAQRLDEILQQFASRLPAGLEVEILVVGGAAALLGGYLPPELTTFDCDVAEHQRPHWAALQRAAGETAVTFGLSPSWLNTECQSSTVRRLPPDWLERSALWEFDSLRVRSIGRLDFLAMKVMAGRDKDIEHLNHLGPFTSDERHFVARYLDDIVRRFPQESRFADDARLLWQELSS